MLSRYGVDDLQIMGRDRGLDNVQIYHGYPMDIFTLYLHFIHGMSNLYPAIIHTPILQEHPNLSSSWTTFSKNLEVEKIFLRFCCFVRFWKINLQNTSSVLNYILKCGQMLKENLQTYPNIHQKILHFQVVFSSKSDKFTKKEQNLFFKEPKEHFLDMSVLYRT